MIRLTPISITATSQQYAVEATENLCQPFCLTSAVQPQGTIAFSVGQTKVVGGVAYVELLCNGNVVYHPVCGGCSSKVKQFSENAWLGFVGNGTPTITVTATAPLQMASNVKCNNRAYGWSIVSGVTITATFPA